MIRHRPALRRAAITDASQSFEEAPGGRPIVVLRFSARGQTGVARLTRRVAARGAASAPPGLSTDEAGAVSHHFAIRLDDELLAVPFVHFKTYPHGFGETRALDISGGFTINAAVELAARIDAPPLPRRTRLVRG